MKPLIRRIDWYIISKFVGTYFATIGMLMAIVIMIDVNEKLDDFIDNKIPLKSIILDYYIGFIPYFMNLFSSLFIFLSVILFTSNLAEHSEIIAMMACGMSFKRLLVPYLISASLIAVFNGLLGSFVIPQTNVRWKAFQDKYVEKTSITFGSNIQMQVDTGVVAYFERYDNASKMGYNFSLESFEGHQLRSRLTARRIRYDTLNRWHITDYLIRRIDDKYETIEKGAERDTLIDVQPSDFLIGKGDQEQMITTDLTDYIAKQKMRGIANIKDFEIEYHKRFAMPFAAFILTLIGVSLSARKVKGGLGLNIGTGLALSFSYILFSTVSSSFAVSGMMSPWFSVWLPNFVFALIAYLTYRKAPK